MQTTMQGLSNAANTRPMDALATPPGAKLPSDLIDAINVLLVEDTPMNQRLATMVLKSMGATVDLAENGHEGVYQRQRGLHDLILMDLQMPMLDGLTATEQIRRWERENAQPRIPIVAMTAHGMEADRIKCLEAGMDAFLVKPVPLAEYRKVLDNCRDQRPVRQMAQAMLQAPHATESLDMPILLDLPRAHAFVGDAAGVMNMLPVLAASLESDVPQIEQLLAVGDVASANRLLHPLKGFIPVFCVDDVIDQITTVEVLSKSAQAHEVWKAFTTLRPVLDQLSREVRRLLACSGEAQQQNSVGNAQGTFI